MPILRQAPESLAYFEQEAWEYLKDKHPTLAEKIDADISAGWSPQDLSRRIKQGIGDDRIAITKRVELAAIYRTKERADGS